MNANKSAFPTHGNTLGLTKREYFAAVALQGMLANPYTIEEIFFAKKGNAQQAATEIIEQSVACADRMLAELEKL